MVYGKVLDLFDGSNRGKPDGFTHQPESVQMYFTHIGHFPPPRKTVSAGIHFVTQFKKNEKRILLN